MPTDELSWSLLTQVLQDWSGSNGQIKQVQRLSGGVISNTARIDLTDGRQAVLKISPHRVDYTLFNEVHQLQLLRELGVPTPKVFHFHMGELDNPHTYLLMEYVKHPSMAQLSRQVQAPSLGEAFETELAQIMLKLHTQTGQHFGPLSQPDHACWLACFKAAFDPIVHEVFRMQALSVRTTRQLARIHDRVDRLIATSDPPRLTHGDFWAGNILVDVSNTTPKVAAVLDPVCKYWHAETELAYLDLYSALTGAFRKAYQQTFRLTDSYHKVRKPVYQLYFMLNQLQLHGPTSKLLDQLTNSTEAVSRFV